MSSNFMWQVGGCGCGCECQYDGCGTIIPPGEFVVVSGSYNPATHMLSPGGIVTVNPNIFQRFMIFGLNDCVLFTPLQLNGLRYVYGTNVLTLYGRDMDTTDALYYGETNLTEAEYDENDTASAYYFGIDENGYYTANSFYLPYIRTPILFENARPGIKNNSTEPMELQAIVVYPVVSNPYDASANCGNYGSVNKVVNCNVFPNNALQGTLAGNVKNEFSELFNSDSISLTLSGFSGFGGAQMNRSVTLTPVMHGISRSMYRMSGGFSYTQSAYVPITQEGYPIASPENFCEPLTQLNFDLEYNVLVTAEMQSPQYYGDTDHPCGLRVTVEVDIPRIYFFVGTMDYSIYYGSPFYCYQNSVRDFPERYMRMYAGGFTSTLRFDFQNVSNLVGVSCSYRNYNRDYIDTNPMPVAIFNNGLLPGVSDTIITNSGNRIGGYQVKGFGYRNCEYETKIAYCGDKTTMTWSNTLPFDPEMYAFKIAGNPTCKVDL